MYYFVYIVTQFDDFALSVFPDFVVQFKTLKTWSLHNHWMDADPRHKSPSGMYLYKSDPEVIQIDLD